MSKSGLSMAFALMCLIMSKSALALSQVPGAPPVPGSCFWADGNCLYNPCADSPQLELRACTGGGFPCLEGCQLVTLAGGAELCGLAGAPDETDFSEDELLFLALNCAEGYPVGSECRETVLRSYEALGCDRCVEEIAVTQEIATYCGSFSEDDCDGQEAPCGGVIVVDAPAVECGADAEPPCADTGCDGELIEVEGVCEACGARGEPVCPGNVCTAPYIPKHKRGSVRLCGKA